MNGIDAAVFDLGGVLVEVDVRAPLAVWSRATGLAPEAIAERIKLGAEHDRLQRGQIDGPAFHRHVAGQIGAEISYDDFLAGWNAVFGPAYENTMQFIAELKKTMRVAALSNTNHMHAEFWPGLAHVREALETFEKVFLSHQIGARKPEPAAYQAVLDWLKLPSDRVAFFDDLEENVEAARALGMRGFVVKQPCDFEELTRS